MASFRGDMFGGDMSGGDVFVGMCFVGITLWGWAARGEKMCVLFCDYRQSRIGRDSVDGELQEGEESRGGVLLGNLGSFSGA